MPSVEIQKTNQTISIIKLPSSNSKTQKVVKILDLLMLFFLSSGDSLDEIQSFTTSPLGNNISDNKDKSNGDCVSKKQYSIK